MAASSAPSKILSIVLATSSSEAGSADFFGAGACFAFKFRRSLRLSATARSGLSSSESLDPDSALERRETVLFFEEPRPRFFSALSAPGTFSFRERTVSSETFFSLASDAMSAKTPIFRPDSLAFISSAIFPSLGAPKPHLDALAFVARTRISLSTLFTAQAPGCAHYAQLPRRRAAERPFAFIETPRTKWADFFGRACGLPSTPDFGGYLAAQTFCGLRHSPRRKYRMRPLHAGQKAHLCYSLTFTPSPAIFGDKHPPMLTRQHRKSGVMHKSTRRSSTL